MRSTISSIKTSTIIIIVVSSVVVSMFIFLFYCLFIKKTVKSRLQDDGFNFDDIYKLAEER